MGIAIGGVAGLAAWGVSFVAPESFVIATAFGLTIVASGAVHLDGFLDSCDALVASVPPERRLEIMKDPRHGTFAVAGLAVVAVWWLAGLTAIPAAVLPWALAFAGGAARLASALNAYVIPYGRAGALARTFAARPPAAVLAIGALALVALAWGARAPLWLAAAVGAVLLAQLIGRGAARRLGGVLVGDVYGATIVVLEVGLIASIALLQGH